MCLFNKFSGHATNVLLATLENHWSCLSSPTCFRNILLIFSWPHQEVLLLLYKVFLFLLVLSFVKVKHCQHLPHYNLHILEEKDCFPHSPFHLSKVLIPSAFPHNHISNLLIIFIALPEAHFEFISTPPPIHSCPHCG